MKKVGKIIWIVALIAIIVLIGVVGFGYYKKATFTSQNPVATGSETLEQSKEFISRPSTRSGCQFYKIGK